MRESWSQVLGGRVNEDGEEKTVVVHMHLDARIRGGWAVRGAGGVSRLALFFCCALAVSSCIFFCRCVYKNKRYAWCVVACGYMALFLYFDSTSTSALLWFSTCLVRCLELS